MGAGGLRRLLRLRRGFRAGEQNVANEHGSVRLPMPLQPAVVLPPAKVLDIELGRRVIHDFPENPHAFNERLTNPKVAGVLVQEHPRELQAGTDLGVPVINPDDVPFADAILARTVLKHSVHERIPAMPASELLD